MNATSEMPPITVNRQQLFAELYLAVFPKVAAFISQRSGSLEDAQDIFQDALMVYYEKHTSPGFVCHISREAYVLGIAKHLWYRQFNSKSGLPSFPIDENDFAVTEEPDINSNKILQLLEQTGKKCLDLLHAFYYEQLPVKQISKLFGYSSVHSVSVQKYKCMEKVRDTIKEKSITYAHFID